MSEFDAVANPKHYARSMFGKEPIDWCEWLPYNLGNALKYVWRAGIKTPDFDQDLDKAVFYLARESMRRAEYLDAATYPNPLNIYGPAQCKTAREKAADYIIDWLTQGGTRWDPKEAVEQVEALRTALRKADDPANV